MSLDASAELQEGVDHAIERLVIDRDAGLAQASTVCLAFVANASFSHVTRKVGEGA